MNRDGVQRFIDMDADRAATVLEELSACQIKELSKKVNEVREELYPRERGGGRSRGNARKILYPDELHRFFGAVRNRAIKYAFLFQFFFCLRKSEIGHCEWHPDMGRGRPGMLEVYQPKNDRKEFVPVHGKTTELLRNYEEFSSYSKGYLNNAFISVREDAGLDHVVGRSSDGRDLYQFGTHSLRHTSASYFADEVGADTMKFRKWLRHRDDSSDDTYFHYMPDVWRDDLEDAFDTYYELIR